MNTSPSSHFAEIELSSDRKTDIAVSCPNCQGTNVIRRTTWMATVRAERDKTEHMREQEQRTGKIEGFKCPTCKQQIANAEWHRAYEREQFAASGWYTPRMVAS